MADMKRTDWFVTFSGRVVHVLSPRAEEIDIVDIGHALSHICRFGGHVTHFYSVAQHSVQVSLLVPPDLALAALLHDATEAYIGDVIRPLKRELGRAYGDIEERWEQAIGERFGVTFDAPEIKQADLQALATERQALVPHAARLAESGERRWVEDELGMKADPKTFAAPMDPANAYSSFMFRYRMLTGPAFHDHRVIDSHPPSEE